MKKEIEEEVGFKEELKDGVKSIYVSGKSPVPRLASSITHSVMTHGVKNVQIRAIGASSVNQATKSMIVASGELASKGIHVSFIPGFDTITEENEERTIVIWFIHSLN